MLKASVRLREADPFSKDYKQALILDEPTLSQFTQRDILYSFLYGARVSALKGQERDSDVLNEKRVQKYDEFSAYKTLNGRERFSIPPVSFGVILVPVSWLM
jgi:hypothetical protein